MKFIRQILIVFFNIIDQFFHQKRIEKLLKTEKLKLETFIDVGAFEGKYTDLIFKIQKNCKVIMIEPQKKYHNLIKNKYRNDDRVEILRAGLSDKKDSMVLNINKHEITSTFSKFKSTNKYLNLKAILFESKLENMTTTKETVEVLTLEEILKEKKLNFIDLVKIDTGCKKLSKKN